MQLGLAEGLGAVEVHKLTKTVNDAVGVELSARMAPQQMEAISQTGKLLIQGAPQASWWTKQANDLQHNFSAEIQMGMLRGASIQDMTKVTRDMLNTKYASQAESQHCPCCRRPKQRAAPYGRSSDYAARGASAIVKPRNGFNLHFKSSITPEKLEGLGTAALGPPPAEVKTEAAVKAVIAV